MAFSSLEYKNFNIIIFSLTTKYLHILWIGLFLCLSGVWQSYGLSDNNIPKKIKKYILGKKASFFRSFLVFYPIFKYSLGLLHPFTQENKNDKKYVKRILNITSTAEEFTHPPIPLKTENVLFYVQNLKSIFYFVLCLFAPR